MSALNSATTDDPLPANLAARIQRLNQTRPDIAACLLRTYQDAKRDRLSVSAAAVQLVARLEPVCGKRARRRDQDHLLLSSVKSSLMLALRGGAK